MPSSKLFDLSGRVAAVNGGIGRSIALGLAQAGAAVAVLARNEEKNQCVLGELHALGVPTFAMRVDVTARGATVRLANIASRPIGSLLPQKVYRETGYAAKRPKA